MSQIQTEDIITNILSRLPVKSIGRFRCVSKTWCNLLTNPHFIKTQLNHVIQNNIFSLLVLPPKNKIYSVDYDSTSSTCSEPVEIGYKFNFCRFKPNDDISFDIWGSCNGLICFSTGRGFVYVWNPSTNEYKEIRPPSNCFPEGSEMWYETPLISYGFGYDCSIEDYMLVRIVTFKSYSELDIFTLRSDSWMVIPNVPYKMSYGVILIFNGALHWIANTDGGTKEAIVLATYKIGDGRFKDMPLPKDFENKFEIVYVGVLAGCLCLAANLYGVHTEVWMMKNYGVQESWTRLFTIDQHTSAGSFKFLKLIQPLKNGDIMFQKDHCALFIYDPNQGEARTRKIRGITREMSIWAFSGSLVSPNHITSPAQEQIRQA